jgi:hypothetical protein
LLVLCAIAVLVAEVFGVQSGYICDCGGAVEIVKSATCAGTHGIDCHDDIAGSSNQENEKTHIPAKDDIQGAPGSTHNTHVPSPALLCVLSDYFFVFGDEGPLSKPSAWSLEPTGPPINSGLTRHFVLRI